MTILKKIETRKKFFKVLLDATRLRCLPIKEDEAEESLRLKHLEQNLYAEYNTKMLSC